MRRTHSDRQEIDDLTQTTNTTIESIGMYLSGSVRLPTSVATVAARVVEAAPGAPTVVAEIRAVSNEAAQINTIYNEAAELFNNRRYRAAVPLLKNVLDLLPDKTSSFAIQVALVTASGYYYSGHHKESLALLNTLLVQVQGKFPPESLEEALVYVTIALAKGEAGDYEGKATVLEKTVIPLLTKWLGSSSEDTLSARTQLANTYGCLKQPQRQKDMLTKILEEMEAISLADSIEGTRVLGNLGNAHGSLGEYDLQLSVLLKVLAKKEKMFGENHVELARTLHNIALAYGNQGEIENKRQMLERSVAIKRANCEGESLDLAISLRSLAHVYFDLSNGGANAAHHARYIALLTEVLGIFEAQPEPNLREIERVRMELRGIYSKPSVRQVPQATTSPASSNSHDSSGLRAQKSELTPQTRAIYNEAATKFNNGDYEGAAPLLKQVFDSLVHKISSFVMETAFFTATAYSLSGQHEESLALLNILLVKVQEKFFSQSLEEARVYLAIATAKGKACDNEGKAVVLENTVIPLFTKWLGPLAKDTLSARVELANTYGNVKKTEEQVDMLMDVLGQMITTLPPDAIEIKRTETNLVNAIGKQGENEQKRSLLLKVLETKERKYGENHVALVITLYNIGISYGYQGDNAEALKMFERCMTINKNCYEPNSIEHVVILRAKARVHFHFSQQNGTNAQEHYKKYIECLEEAKRILEVQTGPMPKEYSDRLERINKELAGTKAAHNFSQYHPLTFFGDATCRLTGLDPVCISGQKFSCF